MTNKHIPIPEFAIRCLLILYILFRIPITTHYISVMIFMLPLALLLLGLFLYGPISRDTGSRFFMVSLVYFGAIIVDELFIESRIVYMLWNALLNYLPLVIGYFLIEHQMDKTIRTFITLYILSILITGITTYLGLQEFPDASRDLASGTNNELYGKMNIGGFSFIYSLAISHPMLVYYLRKRNHSILSVVMTILMSMCITASRYTIALVVFSLSLLCYLIPVNDTDTLRKGTIFLILLCLVIIFVLAPTILDYLAEQEFLKDYAANLTDISRMLQGKDVLEGNTVSRQKVYETSWNSFVKYPVFGGLLSAEGSLQNVSGGHSYFLDTMAKWGLVGLVLVLAMIWTTIKWYWSLFSGSYAIYYVLFSLALALVVAALNPVFWTFELGTLIPLFAYSAMHHTRQKENATFFGITIRWK